MVTDDICMRWISLEKSRENEILKILSVALRRIFSSEIYDYNKLQEIRLRMNEPLIVIYDNREYFVTEKGKRTTECKKAYMVAPADIRETLEYISNYSLYAYEDEIRQGFITIQGGSCRACRKSHSGIWNDQKCQTYIIYQYPFVTSGKGVL